MADGRAHDENYSMQIPIDPIIIRAIEILGTGPNLDAKLTSILNVLLTDRLEEINARILECQVEGLKNEEGEEEEKEEFSEVSKRSIAVQKQLMVIRQFLAAFKESPAAKEEKDPKVPEVSLNLAQFAALQTLGDKKTRVLDYDLGSMLLDLGNIKLAQLNARIAKELAEKGHKPVSPEKPIPDLLKQKEFLSLLGDLERLVGNMMARSARIYHIHGGIKILMDTCASILQVPASEIQERVENLLQKEQSVTDALSYQVLYDTFKQNVKDFERIRQQMALERKETKQLGRSQISKLLNKQKRRNATAAKKKAPDKEIPSPPTPSPIAISDVAVLDNLTSDPISMRDLLQKMHIVDISDARWLRQQVKELEKLNKIQVTTVRGRKCYSKG